VTMATATWYTDMPLSSSTSTLTYTCLQHF
jgi:hypothetical protein